MHLKPTITPSYIDNKHRLESSLFSYPLYSFLLSVDIWPVKYDIETICYYLLLFFLNFMWLCEWYKYMLAFDGNIKYALFAEWFHSEYGVWSVHLRDDLLQLSTLKLSYFTVVDYCVWDLFLLILYSWLTHGLLNCSDDIRYVSAWTSYRHKEM